MNEEVKKVVVWGVGGVGGYFGGVLAARCKIALHVTFIARNETYTKLASSGLSIDSELKGSIHLTPSQYSVVRDPSEIKGKADLIIVAVKGEDALRAILPQFSTLIGSHTVVLPLQNGLDAPKLIAEAIGGDKVFSAYCKIVSRILQPAHILHESSEPTIGFGEFLGGASTERIDKVKAILESAGITVEIPPDINVAMWHKLMLISSVSGAGALTRAPFGVFLLATPEASAQVQAALLEVAAVARAHGVNLTDEAALKLHEWLKQHAAGNAYNSTSSLQRDVMNGLPSELEWQSGLIVRKAKEVGVPVPVHSLFYAMLLPQEQKARGLLTFSTMSVSNI